MPRPPVDLTDHLQALAGQVGYDIDPDELDPVTGHEPRLVTDWALRAGRHAALGYGRWLLDGPEEFLSESLADGEDTIAALLLPGVVAAGRRLDTELRHVTSLFTHSCATLAGTRLGLIWPRETAAPPVRPDPGEHRRLLDALTAAGFAAEHGSAVWTRTHGDGRTTVTVDGPVRLHVQPHHGPAWQATFAMSTPPAAIIAAANA
jgi:hypothetical protein